MHMRTTRSQQESPDSRPKASLVHLASCTHQKKTGQREQPSIFLQQVRVVSSATKQGPSKDLSRPDGVTPLWVATHNGHLAMARLLLQWGADKDEENGITPLFVAARNGHEWRASAELRELDNGSCAHPAKRHGSQVTSLPYLQRLGIISLST